MWMLIEFCVWRGSGGMCSGTCGRYFFVFGGGAEGLFGLFGGMGTLSGGYDTCPGRVGT